MEGLLTYPLMVFYLLGSFLLPQQQPDQSYELERIFYMSRLREKEGLASLKKNADKIDILAPQTYELTSSFKIIGGLNVEIKRIADENNIRIMPLITNSGFKQDIIHSLLISQSAQDEVINGLIYLAEKNNYIGWQFDFENISWKDKDLYSSLIEKTAKAFKEKGLILTVAAVARNVDYENTDFYKNWSGAFDYKRIANAVDFISLMAYDDPKSLGPVASVPYINNVLSYVKDKIPAKKLSFGIPLYYWGWGLEPLKKIRMNGIFSKAMDIRANFKHALGFDPELGTAWLLYSYYDKLYKIWYEDKQAFEIKLDIVKQNNFRGFSAWVLGSEDPEIWSTFAKIN